MGLTQLDIIRKQIESTVKNRAAGETAKLRRKTSLIGEISRLAGRANSAIDGAGRDAARRRAGRRPEELEDDAAWDAPDEGARPYICADGYVRRSPEQTLYTPPDYRRRLLLRAAGLAAAVVLALAALWLLVHYSVLSI